MQGSAQLSANAVPGLGGQGQNLEQVARGLSRLCATSVLACAPIAGLPSASFPLAREMRRIRSTPWVRRHRQWTNFTDNVAFDAWASTRAGTAGTFFGVTGQCARSLRLARDRGARTVVDSVTHHVLDFKEVVDQESARFGIRGVIHPAMAERMIAEYERADAIRVMSRASRDSFVSRGISPERIVIARPPIEVPSGTAAPRAANFRALFVGLLEPWKGFHDAIEAFRRVRHKDASLHVLGSPGTRQVSDYLVKAQRLDGRLDVGWRSVRDAGWLAVYPEADVLIHPSLTDGFGYVVAEAMACGVPAIVTSCTGAAELIEDGVNGFVVRAHDIAGIAERLDHLAGDRELAREMGLRARETIRRELHPMQFDAALRQLLG